MDGGVQQGTSVCGSVLFNVGNLVIKSETVFQNSFPPSSFGKRSPEGLGIGHLIYLVYLYLLYSLIHADTWRFPQICGVLTLQVGIDEDYSQRQVLRPK